MPQIIAHALVEELAKCDDEQAARKAVKAALQTAGNAGFAAEVPQILCEVSQEIERDLKRACGRRRRNLARAVSLLTQVEGESSAAFG